MSSPVFDVVGTDGDPAWRRSRMEEFLE